MAGGSDFLLVNLFRDPLGAPMSPDAVGELCERLATRAKLTRKVRPAHVAAGVRAGNVLLTLAAQRDEVQALLGQKHPSSPQPYLFPDASRLREAIERVPSPRAFDWRGES